MWACATSSIPPTGVFHSEKSGCTSFKWNYPSGREAVFELPPVRHVPVSRWSGDVMKRPGQKKFNSVSHKRARPEVLFPNLKKHASRSGGSRRFYLNFYSLHSVTGNVGDTENDLSRFANGILQELKSWMRSVVGVENLMLLNCKHKSARFYLIILVSSTFNWMKLPLFGY